MNDDTTPAALPTSRSAPETFSRRDFTKIVTIAAGGAALAAGTRKQFT